MGAGDMRVAEVMQKLPIPFGVFVRLGIIREDLGGGRDALHQPVLKELPEPPVRKFVESLPLINFPDRQRLIRVVVKSPDIGDVVVAHPLPLKSCYLTDRTGWSLLGI